MLLMLDYTVIEIVSHHAANVSNINRLIIHYNYFIYLIKFSFIYVFTLNNKIPKMIKIIFKKISFYPPKKYCILNIPY